MADVVVSYVAEDRPLAKLIADGLANSGLSVWWDRHIHGGVDFGKEIERQIDESKAVVVLWSARSRDSDWVRDEASTARDAKKLVPIRTDQTLPPLGFRQVQSLDFDRWNGDIRADAFERLLASIRNCMDIADDESGRSVASVAGLRNAARSAETSSKRSYRVAAAITVVAAIATVVAIAMRHGGQMPSTAPGDGRIEIEAFEPITKTDDLDRLAKGVADMVARALATNDIKTIKPGAANEIAGGAMRATGAEFALRGTVDREGDELVVSADVLQRHEGLVLWSTTIRRAVVEAQRLKVEVSTSVANTLRCAFRIRQGDKNDASIELFAGYLSFCGAGADQERWPELARRIAEVAPQSATSHALVAFANANLSRTTAFHWTERPVAERDRLRELVYDNARAALKAAPTEPSAGLADWALAIVLDPAVGLAEKDKYFANALSLIPDDAFLYFNYALFVGDVGRIDESRGYMMRGLSAEPLQYYLIAWAAYLAAARDVKVARDQFGELKAKAAYPHDADVPFWFDMEWLYGDPMIAKQMAAANPRLIGPFDDDPAKDASGCFNAFLDARIRGIDLTVDQVEAACAKGWHVHPLLVHAYFGHVDWVFNELRDWSNKDFYDLYRTFARMYFLPEFRTVRADPRFMPFMERIGRVDYWLETDQWPDFCKEEELPYDCKAAALAARAHAAQ